ncbi:exodeoxyribonuclease VII large subunit [Candidatus Saccharibacteria bacterium]|nr:exodeoxyribonuclease VII large subunit [Candidatus Saccharibacteria bacterium]
MTDVTLGVSEAIELINQTLDEAYPFVVIEGEVASFKVNQGKFIFFDIKDESSTLGCFMMLFKLKFPIEDGMKVRIIAQPKLTNWGRFSLTVQEIMPVGEGSLKKSFELLKKKLEAEGLFDQSRKRSLPKYPVSIGIVSSSQAAGYKDFIKILQNRWGGLKIALADVPVQGMEAPTQIIGAIAKLNEHPEPFDVIAILRGGGSADDLSAFNHEDVVRAVALSRTPTIVGVGHEIDVSLADLAGDVRAATPSNAAELLVPDKNTVIKEATQTATRCHDQIMGLLDENLNQAEILLDSVEQACRSTIDLKQTALHAVLRTLVQLDPNMVLRRGYGIVRSGTKTIVSVAGVTIKDSISVQLSDGLIEAEVSNVNTK